MKNLTLYLILMLPILGFSQIVNTTVTMVALMDGLHTLEDGKVTNIWGFSVYDFESGQHSVSLPNPSFDLFEGDTLQVILLNESGEGHTIHWHGLDVDQQNDGVPHTSGYVQPGDTFVYRFPLTHAGNYTYHCHVTTTLHLMMGMYGKFIVRPKAHNRVYTNGPTFTNELALLGSEMDERWNDDFMTGGGLNEFSPSRFLINGKSGKQIFDDGKMKIDLGLQDTFLLRLFNIGFSMHRYKFPAAVKAKVVGSDGRQLTNFFETDVLDVYPGERYSVLLSTDNASLEDYVFVTYHHMHQLRLQGHNYIPINNETFPVNINEVKGQIKSSLYPNPAIELVNLRLHTYNNSFPYAIYNSVGQLVKDGFISMDKQQINVGDLTSGIYFLHLNNAEKEVLKLVIQ